MKLFLVLAACCTLAAADDGAITLQPQERQAIVRKIMELNDAVSERDRKIDAQEREIDRLKAKLGCA